MNHKGVRLRRRMHKFGQKPGMILCYRINHRYGRSLLRWKKFFVYRLWKQLDILAFTSSNVYTCEEGRNDS